jgi:hypothetical protein
MGNKQGRYLTTSKGGDERNICDLSHSVVTIDASASVTETSKLIVNKLNHIDVSLIFSPQEIQAIRKNLSYLLEQSEDELISISKEEFFRFLGATISSLYVNRLYGIFDVTGKGHVRIRLRAFNPKK